MMMLLPLKTGPTCHWMLNRQQPSCKVLHIYAWTLQIHALEHAQFVDERNEAHKTDFPQKLHGLYVENTSINKWICTQGCLQNLSI